MPVPRLNLIVAACNNNGIGKNGQLPWNLRKDMDHFRKITTQTKDPEKKNAVIMGRKTWFSIPEKFRPLKGRVNVVLSRELKEVPEGVYISRSLPEALELLRGESFRDKIENINIIGGSSVYEEAVTTCDCRIYLTRVLADLDCDTFLPEIKDTVFRKIENPPNISTELQEENDLKFRFEVYDKVETI